MGYIGKVVARVRENRPPALQHYSVYILLLWI